jgi:hypothetical protein
MRLSKACAIIVLMGVSAGILACGSRPLQPEKNCKSPDVMGTEDGKLTLTYRFTKPIEPSSVTNGGTVIISTDRIEVVDGTITFPDEQSFKFKSLQSMQELFPEGKGVLKVRIVGRSRFQEWVADKDGDPVDGDCDGTSGGDFYAEYTF